MTIQRCHIKQWHFLGIGVGRNGGGSEEDFTTEE